MSERFDKTTSDDMVLRGPWSEGNVSRSHALSQDTPWPSGADEQETQALREGWAALDALLRQSTPLLTSAQLDEVSRQIVQRIQRARRWRQRALLAVAASLVVIVGTSLWRSELLVPQAGDPGAVAQNDRLDAAGSLQTPPTNDISTAAATSDSDTEAFWDEDAWTASVAGVQQTADDVDADWRVPLEGWTSLRAQMDEFEDELNAYPL